MGRREQNADTEPNPDALGKIPLIEIKTVPAETSSAKGTVPHTSPRNPDTEPNLNARGDIDIKASNISELSGAVDFESAHTTLKRGGGLTISGSSTSVVKTNRIETANVQPARVGLRFQLTPLHLGKLERLAKSRFEISRLTDEDLTKWEAGNPDLALTIAQSVNASSEIEGEEIAADQVSLVAGIVTEDGSPPQVEDSDTDKKIRAQFAINRAFFWALTRDSKRFVTYDFIMEVHRRMFETTNAEIAGKPKLHDVMIKGGEYDIQTLSFKKTEEFLVALCDRANRQYEAARDHSEYSSLLCAAEFILDFLAIHPFADGNGRIARLLSTYLLEKAGYHFARFYNLDFIILETKLAYYEVLFQSQRNWHESNEDLSPWIAYYIDSVFQQWTRAYQKVRDNANSTPNSSRRLK